MYIFKTDNNYTRYIYTLDKIILGINKITNGLDKLNIRPIKSHGTCLWSP